MPLFILILFGLLTAFAFYIDATETIDKKHKPTIVCEQLKPNVTRCEYTYDN